MAIIKIKRGLKSNLPILLDGELGFTTDTNETYISDGANNYKLISENDIVTSISDPGSDLVVPSEQAVRDAINEIEGAEVAKEIDFLSGEIYQNSLDISTNLTLISTNSDNIDNIESDVNWLSGEVEENSTNISTNISDIINLQSDVDFLSGSIPSYIDDLLDVDTSSVSPISGDFLKFDGNNWVPSDITTVGGGLTWNLISSDITAEKDNGYLVDAGIDPVIIQFPANPEVGDPIGIKALDITNDITLAGNGSKIEGSAEDLTFDVAAGATFVYSGIDQGWVVVTEISSGSTESISETDINALSAEIDSNSSDIDGLQSDVTYLSGEIPQTTDELDEGISNLYYTDDRVITAINSDIDHGSTANHDYYTDSDVDSHLSGGTGIDYSAGTITNTDTGSDAVTSHESIYNHNDIATNSNDIDNLQSDTSWLSSEISQNTSDISTNISNINNLQSDVNWLSAEINSLSGSSGGIEWSIITEDTIAVQGNGYLIDASINPVNLTLPEFPVEGNPVGIKAIDVTNAVTVLRNGNNIEGSAEDLEFNTTAGAIFVYSNNIEGWVVVTEISSGSDGSDVSNTDIIALSAEIDSNSSDITNLQSDVDYLSGNIDTNTSNITTNSNNIDSLQSDTSWLSGEISSNSSDITNIQSDVDYLSANIPVSIDDLSDVDTTSTVPSSGDFLKYDGVNWIPSDSAAGGLTWNKISSDTTAEKDNGYLVDASIDPVTIQFPLNPEIGDPVGVKALDVTNNVILDGNGSKIEGYTEDLIFDITAGATFVYSGLDYGWVAVTEIASGTEVTSSNIDALSAEIDNNSSDIIDIQSDITYLSAGIDENTSNILSNITNINNLQSDTAWLSGEISSNITNINNLQSDIDYLSGSIPVSIDDLSDVDTSSILPISGDFLKFDGSSWVPSDSASGGLTWNLISSDTTAKKDNGYMVDAGLNPVILQLPASPEIGDPVGIKALDITNDITLDGNGSKIEGSADNLEFNITAGSTFVYSGIDQGWVVVTEISSGTSVTSSNIDALSAEIDSNSSDIIDLNTDVDYLSANIDTNTSNISSNDNDISNLQSDTIWLSGEISQNVLDISTNSYNISNLQSDVEYLSGSIDNNTTNITINSNDIDSLQSDTIWLSGEIDQNTTDISVNSSDISNLQYDVNYLSGEIDSLSGASGGLEWSIITTDVVMEKNNGYLVDASDDIINLEFPTTPEIGDPIGVKAMDITNDIVLTGNGNKIEGSSEDLEFNTTAGATFVYSGVERGWIIVTEISSGSTVEYTDIEALSAEIDSNSTDIIINSNNIDNLQTDTAWLSGEIYSNDNDISNLQTDVNYLSANIDTNTSNILSNDSDINNLQADTARLSAEIDSLSGMVGGIEWSVITEDTTAVQGNGYLIDASSNSVNLTLPTSPIEGDSVGIKAIDVANTINILRNGNNIEGSADDLEFNTTAGVTLVYSNITEGWVIVTEISSGSTVEYTDIEALSAEIDSNSTDISDIQSDITYLSGSIDNNSSDIDNIQTDVVWLSGEILENTLGINSNSDNITILQSDVNYLSGSVPIIINDLSDVDTSSIPPVSGDFLKFDGSNWVPSDSDSAAGGLTWNLISSDITAEKDNGYLVDAETNTVTIQLPASPAIGDSVGVKAINVSNYIILNGNGSNIEGESSDLNFNAEAGATFVYSGITEGWVIVTEISSAGSFTDADITSMSAEIDRNSIDIITNINNIDSLQSDVNYLSGSIPLFIGDLGDVDISGISGGQVIVYNSTSGNFEAENPPAGYTDADVDAHLTGGTGINYDVGEISIDSTVVATQTWVTNNFNDYTLESHNNTYHSETYLVEADLSRSNWDTAYSERRQWDGGSTNLNASTGRSSLSITNHNQFTVTSASDIADGAESGYRINADSFHTNGLGQGQIYIEGSRIDANTTMYICDGRAGSQSSQNVVFGAEVTATKFNGPATSAYYADLAEKYFYDGYLRPGTVVEIPKSSDNEIEPCGSLSNTVIGVVSEKPAYLMNSRLEKGITVGIVGRLPVFVKGYIKKGDFIVPSHYGYARKGKFWEYKYKIGIALESKDEKGIELVECFIK